MIRLAALALLLATTPTATARDNALLYERSDEHPYGRPNPAAPKEISQFAFMIGRNDCTESRRTPGGDEWVDGKRTWDAWYTLDGYAIMDSGRSGASTNGNLRVYDANKGQWFVTFFSMPGYSSGIWSGGATETGIELNQPQKAPGTDLDGFSRLTFSNISDEGFDWLGEWVSADGNIRFPFWRISCKRSG